MLKRQCARTHHRGERISTCSIEFPYWSPFNFHSDVLIPCVPSNMKALSIFQWQCNLNPSKEKMTSILLVIFWIQKKKIEKILTINQCNIFILIVKYNLTIIILRIFLSWWSSSIWCEVLIYYCLFNSCMALEKLFKYIYNLYWLYYNWFSLNWWYEQRPWCKRIMD